MADEEWIDLKRKSQILVTVEDVLPDIIVVSFLYHGTLFQGVLLDSKKKLLPCGIVPPTHLGPPLGTAILPLEDKLFSASQRYTYFQEKTSPNIDRIQTKRDIRPPARFKNARMTVRLRPRQVLCSKCRGICNENSENVDVSSRKKKNQENVTISNTTTAKGNSRPERRLRSSGEISPRPVFPDNPRAQPKKCNNSDVPQSKKKRLSAHIVSNVNSNWKREQEETNYPLLIDEDRDDKIISSAAAEEEDPLSLPDGHSEKPDGDGNRTASGDDSQAEETDPLDISGSRPQRILRKKRSVGSMEDLWDENVFEEASKFADKKVLGKSKTPVIKISFGSGTGEGTVLKIPAKPQDIPSESENEEKKREKTKRDASAKLAKKALKKAKKEARRKLIEGASPARVGCSSPRYPSMSPRYFTSFMSPRQNMGNSSPAYEILHKKHKHKVKHKKRHKDDKRKDKDSQAEGESVVEEAKDEGIRSECLKQKLSISLKRLNANAYKRRRRESSPSGSTSDASDEHSDVDAVPDFPGSPVMIRVPTPTVSSCQTSDGRSMAVGDVVWGKIHGFPWWPGKVLSITSKEDGMCTSPQAHVSWYGSSTSSLMSCDQLNPFLETFQMRYNKKKRGPYKEAIKQATTEARRGDIEISNDIFSSPTQVDVAS